MTNNYKSKRGKMNKTVKLLMLSDVFIYSGLGLISPIMAIFISGIKGGSISSVGIASAIYLITRSIFQIFLSRVFNPKDRLWMLKLGTLLTILVPIGYILSTNVIHIYLTQLLYGVAAGFAFPSWYSLFVCNLEKGKQGSQLSVYSASVSICMAIAAYLGALLVQSYNFKLVFVLTGLIALFGFLILFGLEKKVLKKT